MMKPPSTTHVYLVDDDRAMLESLAFVLNQAGLSCSSFSDPFDFLNTFQDDGLGCLILDLAMPGMSGIEVLRELRTRGCKNSVIFLTGNGTISLAVEAMQLNAIDFLEKPIDHLQLLEAVETTINLCREGLEEKQEEDSIARRIQSLTKRQKEVMECIVDGLPSKRIAKRLQIDIKTVEFHRSQLAKRMEVRSVTELVQLLTRYTLMTQSDHNNLS